MSTEALGTHPAVLGRLIRRCEEQEESVSQDPRSPLPALVVATFRDDHGNEHASAPLEDLLDGSDASDHAAMTISSSCLSRAMASGDLSLVC